MFNFLFHLIIIGLQGYTIFLLQFKSSSSVASSTNGNDMASESMDLMNFGQNSPNLDNNMQEHKASGQMMNSNSMMQSGGKPAETSEVVDANQGDAIGESSLSAKINSQLIKK